MVVAFRITCLPIRLLERINPFHDIVYVCMYLCMYVCMYASISVSKSMRLCVHPYVCLCVCL